MSTIRTQGLGGVNLLGRSFVHASQQHRLIKRWGKGLFVYVVVVTGLVSIMSGGGAQREELLAASGSLEAKLESRKRELAGKISEASTLRKQLRAAEAVGRHPQWGDVLALIATKANGRVVISGLSFVVSEPLRTGDAAAKASKAKTEGAKEAFDPRSATITLNGQAQNLAAVNEYVLALEDMNLFDQVRLKDATNIDNGSGLTTTRFEIACRIEERKIGGKP